jgi:phosphoribosylformylglycinamidine synthase II
VLIPVRSIIRSMPVEPQGTKSHRELGLSDAEYAAIERGLGRAPSTTELGMFAVLWSEHCSYKSSKNVLKFFSRYRESVEGSGLENAGVVEIGSGWGVAFKIESHNHPSAVEPYQGAATGVGGIIRDVLTMGARPIACLDSLRFGDPTRSTLDRRLFDGVVRGIGGYGNCIGVPTVAGDIQFHERYSGSPLVNAMCVGLVRMDRIATASADAVGASVMYLGSATGRDGIHGASFASEVLGEDSESKRPNVQIGDPFAGKLLIEATLEALETGAILAIQDMGAAGLTCSTCEMSAKGGTGMEIDLDAVPLRDDTMRADEIMLSETQERMLAVVEPGREGEVIAIFEKWGLPAAAIGRVTDSGRVVVRHRGEVVADVPAEFIADGCPLIDLPAKEPEAVALARTFCPQEVPIPQDLGKALLTLLGSPNIASRCWVYRQYDYTVQTRTAVPPGAADAAVLVLREAPASLAMKTDGNGRWTFADPYVGGQLALIEAARNVACTGARPIGATDCLNFGDPNRPDVFFQFREAVRGLAEAAEALEIPVLSGNVSFYNETSLGEVLPTPVVGVVGVLGKEVKPLVMGFPPGRGYIYLVSGHWTPRHASIGASEYLATVHRIEGGQPDVPDLASEKSLLRFMEKAANEGLVDCAHDVSEGGLAVAVAEMCIAGGVGAHVLLDSEEHYLKHILGPVLHNMTAQGAAPSEAIYRSLLDEERQHDPWAFSERVDAHLFGETPSRIVLGISADKCAGGAIERLIEIASELGLNLNCIGSYDVAHRHLQFLRPGESLFRIALEEAKQAYERWMPQAMGEA